MSSDAVPQSITVLPNDILHLIPTYLDQYDKINLSKSCSKFNTIVTAHLYQNVVIIDSTKPYIHHNSSETLIRVNTSFSTIMRSNLSRLNIENKMLNYIQTLIIDHESSKLSEHITNCIINGTFKNLRKLISITPQQITNNPTTYIFYHFNNRYFENLYLSPFHLSIECFTKNSLQNISFLELSVDNEDFENARFDKLSMMNLTGLSLKGANVHHLLKYWYNNSILNQLNIKSLSLELSHIESFNHVARSFNVDYVQTLHLILVPHIFNTMCPCLGIFFQNASFPNILELTVERSIELCPEYFQFVSRLQNLKRYKLFKPSLYKSTEKHERLSIYNHYQHLPKKISSVSHTDFLTDNGKGDFLNLFNLLFATHKARTLLALVPDNITVDTIQQHIMYTIRPPKEAAHLPEIESLPQIEYLNRDFVLEGYNRRFNSKKEMGLVGCVVKCITPLIQYLMQHHPMLYKIDFGGIVFLIYTNINGEKVAKCVNDDISIIQNSNTTYAFPNLVKYENHVDIYPNEEEEFHHNHVNGFDESESESEDDDEVFGDFGELINQHLFAPDPFEMRLRDMDN